MVFWFLAITPRGLKDALRGSGNLRNRGGVALAPSPGRTSRREKETSAIAHQL